VSDGGSSGRTHIEPLTRIMARRIEEKEGVKKNIILCRINF